MVIVVDRGENAEDSADYVRGVLAADLFLPVTAVYLREKSFSDAEYFKALDKIYRIVRGKAMLYSSRIGGITTQYPDIAFQLSFGEYIKISAQLSGRSASVSVHSAEEAVTAVELGAKRLMTGHIFATKSKQSPPRGLNYLRAVCASVAVPVTAIGGITPSNFMSALETGAADVAVMNTWLNIQNPPKIGIKTN